MTFLSSTVALLTFITLTCGYDSGNSPTYLNIPEQNTYNDQSALKVKSNLESSQYQDFIHQLYRFDNENLKRVDSLFTHPGQQQQQQQQVQQAQQEATPSYNYNGYQAHSRRRREAALIRPLFVYRTFADRTRGREQDRILRRNYVVKHHSPKKYQAPYAYNRVEE